MRCGARDVLGAGSGQLPKARSSVRFAVHVHRLWRESLPRAASQAWSSPRTATRWVSASFGVGASITRNLFPANVNDKQTACPDPALTIGLSAPVDAFRCTGSYPPTRVRANRKTTKPRPPRVTGDPAAHWTTIPEFQRLPRIRILFEVSRAHSSRAHRINMFQSAMQVNYSQGTDAVHRPMPPRRCAPLSEKCEVAG